MHIAFEVAAGIVLGFFALIVIVLALSTLAFLPRKIRSVVSGLRAAVRGFRKAMKEDR